MGVRSGKKAKKDLLLFTAHTSELSCFESLQRACIHVLLLYINFENQAYKRN